jgi:DNA-binding NarL/FixJ family response regulator
MAAGLESILAARALADLLTDAERVTLSERGFEPERTYQSGHLTEYLANLGRFTEARAVGEPFVAAAPYGVEAQAPNLSQHEAMNLGDCYKGLADSYHWQGELERAVSAAAQARILYDATQWVMMLRALADLELRRVLTYESERVAERRRLAVESDAHNSRWAQTLGTSIPRAGILPLLFVEGRWQEARAILESVPETLTGVYLLAVRVGIGPLDRAQGREDAAWAMVNDILPDGPTGEYDGVFRFHIEAVRLGALLTLDAGDPAPAEPWLTAYDDLLLRAEAVIGRAEGQAMWAEYYRRSGDGTRAYQHAERVLAHATEPRQPLALLAAHRLLGELDIEAGRHDEAETHLNESLALAESCQTPYERALTLLALAELCAAKSEQTEAARLLDDVRAICIPLDAKPALARADALTARLAASAPSRTPAYPAGLTAREVDVLRLVAQGLMNAEIAERLFLSERTVEQHMRSIYNKLGSSSRTAATRFAVLHGLT